MRVVLDPNVLNSAVLSPSGLPALLLARWLAGEFELIVSDQLLTELERALAYPKLQARVDPQDAARFVQLLRGSAQAAQDPPHPARRSIDPGDDYLVALAASTAAALVSGDAHLLKLAGDLPVYSAETFLALLGSEV